MYMISEKIKNPLEIEHVPEKYQKRCVPFRM